MESIGVWCVEQDLLHWNRDTAVDSGPPAPFTLLTTSLVPKGFETERKNIGK